MMLSDCILLASVAHVDSELDLRPGDDGNEENANHHCTLDFVHHEPRSDNTAAENSDPHLANISNVDQSRSSRAADRDTTHLMACALPSSRINELCRTAGDGHWSINGARYGSYSSRGGKSDLSQEETNTHSAGDLDRGWQQSDEPLTHADQGQADEDPAFYKDGS